MFRSLAEKQQSRMSSSPLRLLTPTPHSTRCNCCNPTCTSWLTELPVTHAVPRRFSCREAKVHSHSRLCFDHHERPCNHRLGGNQQGCYSNRYFVVDDDDDDGAADGAADDLSFSSKPTAASLRQCQVGFDRSLLMAIQIAMSSTK